MPLESMPPTDLWCGAKFDGLATPDATAILRMPVIFVAESTLIETVSRDSLASLI